MCILSRHPTFNAGAGGFISGDEPGRLRSETVAGHRLGEDVAAEYKGPLERLERYEEIVATQPDVRRKGAANPYTSRNGWMFSFLDADGEISIRLSEDDRAQFMSAYESRISIQYGREMKEFVVVPDDLLDDLDTLAQWFARSYEWVGTLKPKPTTRSQSTS
jgi:hypothetical protein